MAEQQSAATECPGTCNLCGVVFAKRAMSAHLKACLKSHEDGGTAKTVPAFHIAVEGKWATQYWMHVQLPAKANLAELDRFLRDVWLECCGHLSAFTIERRTYSTSPMDDFEEEDMDAALEDVLRPRMGFEHEYDFGSTTHLKLKVVSVGVGSFPAKGGRVRLLARNNPPAIACDSCGKPATQVCVECMYSGKGWLCKTCAPKHKCGEEMLLPVVNSPRVGVCGYTGPG